MTEIIFCGTPKRTSTVQGRVRSTESYALVRSIKHTYSGIHFFHASSCNRRITNIISVVERFGRNPLCSSGRIPPSSQYLLGRRAMMLHQYLSGVSYRRDAPVVSVLYPILRFVDHHDNGIFPLLRHLVSPPNTNDDIEHSSAQGGITVGTKNVPPMLYCTTYRNRPEKGARKPYSWSRWSSVHPQQHSLLTVGNHDDIRAASVYIIPVSPRLSG